MSCKVRQPEACSNGLECSFGQGLDQLTPELVVLENLTTLSGLECIGCMVVMCGADDLDKTA